MAARGKGNSYQGSKWITREKRLAIYIRDGLSCVYCNASIDAGAMLTLDHIKPFSKRGKHHESNLVTACLKCNSSRGDRDLRTFVSAVAAYLNADTTPNAILNHITDCLARPLDIAAAKEIIARRGSWKATLEWQKLSG